MAGILYMYVSDPLNRARMPTARNPPSVLDRANELLGMETVKRLRETKLSLDSRWNGPEHGQAEGMVLSLLRQKVLDARRWLNDYTP
ncbi:hypothetical protein GQ600_1860 [Phytophthora cactorum]|nr:hypothetical protein GQ600_1860 [Phytophthora cactorum]